jgi:hypothetical protein
LQILKKYAPHIAVSLFVCLFIYVFYRTEKTLINQLVIWLFSEETYTKTKSLVTTVLPLNDSIIYSLPEGLWVFCITLTSSFFYLQLQHHKWHLVFVPIVLVFIMEFSQLFHIANGRFDVMDITFSTGFWLLGLVLSNSDAFKEPILQPVNSKSVFCFLSYAIVYLAHVSY